MKFSALVEPEQIVELIERFERINLKVGEQGAISVRDSEGNIWITPDNLTSLNPEFEDIVLITTDDEIEGKHQPSEFLELHKAIYAMNVNVQAICHVNSDVLSDVKNEFHYGMLNTMPNTSKLVGTIAIEHFGDPGNDAWIQTISNHFDGYRATLIFPGLGMLVSGPSLHQVFYKVENIERLIQSYQIAKKIGEIGRPTVSVVENAYSFSPGDFVSLRGRKSFTDFSSFHAELKEMVHVSYENKWITSSTGSFSLRVDNDSFFITPSNIDRFYLEESDVVYIKKGKVEALKKPDDRIWLHSKIYALNPKIKCIAFVNPLEICAFSIVSAEEGIKLFEDKTKSLKIQRLGFDAVFNEEELASRIKRGADLILIEHDSLLVAGVSKTSVISKIDELMKTLS